MQDLFGVRTDINTVITITEDFLVKLKRLKEKHPRAHLNPNYVQLLNNIFQNPDVMFYYRK